MEHYKELDPAITVRWAEEILCSLGICMQSKTYEPSANIYSTSLEDRLHGWSVNGKGVSAELSAASAYGEAMERLQNPFFAYSKFDCEEEALKYKGFLYFPDEETVPWKTALERSPEVKVDIEAAFAASDCRPPKKMELEHLWGRILGFSHEDALQKEAASEGQAGNIILLPYYAVKSQGLQSLPEGVIRRLCGSNGLCAGNTPYEALCQGLSEIFERYAKHLIFTQQLTPPIVPGEYIDAVCPLLSKKIAEIAEKCSCKVLIWDCSLGRGYPVLACCMIDAAHQAYRIKFGAHPLFSVALERCITEMLQGCKHASLQDISELMAPWTKEEQIKWNYAGNLIKNFYYDGGNAPDSIFFSSSSWNFRPWKGQEGFTNAAGVRRMLSILLALSPDVYIRDNSYLGFSAYRIYVPGVSTLGIPCGLQSYTRERLAMRMREMEAGLDVFSDQERVELIRYLTEDCPDGFRIKDVPVDMAVSALYAELKDYKNAAFSLEKLAETSSVVKCAKREMELRAEGYAERDRDHMLELFFSQKAVNAVKSHYRAEEVLGSFLCKTRSNTLAWKIAGDAARESRAAAVSALHRKLKEKMCISPINQEQIRKILNKLTEKGDDL